MGGRKCVLCFPPLQQPEHRNQIQRDKKEYRPFGQRNNRVQLGYCFFISFRNHPPIRQSIENDTSVPFYFTWQRLIYQQKHRCISVNFYVKLRIRFLSPPQKSRNSKRELPLPLQGKQILFFRMFSRIFRLRHPTGTLETPGLGKKENAGSLAKFPIFYPHEGIGAGKARGVYHFYGNWLLFSPFFGKTAKRFALSLGRKYSILFREVFIYRGSTPCMTNVRRKSLWHLLRSPRRTTSRLSP